MPRSNPYLVPTDILADQGTKVAAIYKDDSAENKKKLDGAGLSASTFKDIAEHAEALLNLEVTQEERKMATQREGAEATAAVQQLLRWRLDEVIARARVIFEDDPRLIHFRTGKLRSQRASAVAREAHLLLAAVKRFMNVPEAKAIGLDESVVKQGQKLLDALMKEDTESEVARAVQVQTTAELRELEVELAQMLADVEKRAAIAFPFEHPGRKRYRMNEIRRYVAMQKGRNGTDPSAAVFVEDPAPEPVVIPTDPEPVDA